MSSGLSQKTCDAMSNTTPPSALARHIPGLALRRSYNRSWLGHDLVAGATVFAVLVPSGLAYGDLARLTPAAGLYAALAAMVAYALLGTSRQMIIGPEATTAILVATSVAPLAGGDPLPQVLEALRRLDDLSPLALGIGVATIVALLVLRRTLPKAPGTLLVVALAVVLSSVFDLAGRGIAVVGAIPAGLPRLAFPAVGVADILALASTALSLSLLIFADAVLTARSFAQRHGYSVDANQELAALGAANLGTGLLQAFPTAASSSRSAVLLVLFLVALTGLLASLPTVVLGAIIVVSAANLVDVAELRRLARVRRDEFQLALLTLAGVLLVGIVPGILVAVTVSLFHLISRIYRPSDATLDDVAGWTASSPSRAGRRGRPSRG
jgi:SulP family sulfate permease